MSSLPEHTKRLLQMVATTVEDILDCDGCLERLPQFVEAVLVQTEIPPDLICVSIHLSQCECCREEFEIVVAAVSANPE
ncbi:hypothetical protein [Thalassoglobus sp.]|uniref:hypothetical protein n=1 Tax=Thalassoglobus sp. TaxID=2795869 RepID=UPI003AA99904